MSRTPLHTGLRALVLALGLTALAAGQLQPPPVPEENPLTPEKIVLGKILFWDEQLSSDNSVACGTCHRPASGGSDPRRARHPGPDLIPKSEDDIFGSPGIVRSDVHNDYARDEVFAFAPQVTRRGAASYLLSPWFTELFWDGSAASRFVDPITGEERIPEGGALESQSIEPPRARAEMAHDDRDWSLITSKLAVSKPMALATDWPPDVAAAIAARADYPSLFAAAFGDGQVTPERIAFAIASYERSLVPDQTPWDLFAGGDSGALTPDQQAGLFLFNTQGNCAVCHQAPLFSDDDYHNIGLRPVADDPGRSLVTGDPDDDGRFKTPSLRNVGLRASFMHNGVLTTLTEVVEFYNDGGLFRENLDPRIFPRGLDDEEIAKIVDFLDNGLTDPRVAAGLPPFDRPELRSERIANPLPFGAGHAGTGGIVPSLLVTSSPNVGNLDFKIGMHGGLGGGRAVLGISSEPAPPGTVRRGVAVFIALSPPPARFPVRLADGGPGEGYGTASKAVPNNPALVGKTFYAQWFVKDPGAGGGLAASRGAELTVF